MSIVHLLHSAVYLYTVVFVSSRILHQRHDYLSRSSISVHCGQRTPLEHKSHLIRRFTDVRMKKTIAPSTDLDMQHGHPASFNSRIDALVLKAHVVCCVVVPFGRVKLGWALSCLVVRTGKKFLLCNFFP